MLETLCGWYVRENLGGRTVSLVWEISLLPNEQSDFALIDAESGATLLADLANNDYILYDAYAYATPGNVKVEVRPDNDTMYRFFIGASNKTIRFPMPVPIHIESDITLKVTNEAAANNLSVSLSAIRLSEENLAKFTLLSEIMFKYLPDAVIKGYNIQAGIAGVAGIGAGYTSPATTEKNQLYCKKGR